MATTSQDTLSGRAEKGDKLLASIRGISYPERLAKLKLPSLVHRRKRGDMIELCKFIHGIYHCDTPKFQRTENKHRTKRNSLKIEKERAP